MISKPRLYSAMTAVFVAILEMWLAPMPAGAEYPASFNCLNTINDCGCQFNCTDYPGNPVRRLPGDPYFGYWDYYMPGDHGYTLSGSLSPGDVYNALATAIGKWAAGNSLLPVDLVNYTTTGTETFILQWVYTEDVAIFTALGAVAYTTVEPGYYGDDPEICTLFGTIIYVAADPVYYPGGLLPEPAIWGADCAPFCDDNEYDLNGVLVHEYGHAIGMAHHPDPNETMAAMKPRVLPNDYELGTVEVCEHGASRRLYEEFRPDAMVNHFYARTEAAGVRITWQTSMESNTQRFEIQRAIDWHGPFTEIASADARGPYSKYEVLDPGSTGGIYKLVEIESDGTRIEQTMDQANSETPKPHRVQIAAQDGWDLETAATPNATNSAAVASAEAEWLCFTPSAWANEAEVLADFWTLRGHPAAVVTLESIGGKYQIQNYIGSLGSGSLKYVLLAGDANDYSWWSNDDHWASLEMTRPNFPTQLQHNIIPLSHYELPNTQTSQGMQAFTPYWGTDWLYGDLDQDELPDIAVGRAPVRSAAELAEFVEKTISAATRPDGGVVTGRLGIWSYARDFGTSSGNLVDNLTERLPELISPALSIDLLQDSNSIPMSSLARHDASVAALDAGAGMITVYGTAANPYSLALWIEEPTFSWDEIQNWEHFPFILGATCGQGAVDMTEDPAYGRPVLEKGILSADSGPWGAFGPTRGAWQSGSVAVAQEFLKSVYGPGLPTAGEAARLAIRTVVERSPVYREAALSYAFIGDPLVSLPQGSTPPLQSAIAGAPSQPYQNQFSLFANPVGGATPYSYEWKYRYSPTDPWNDITLGFGPRLITNMPYTEGIEYQLTVTSGSEASVSTTCVSRTGTSPQPVNAAISGPVELAYLANGSWTASATEGQVCGNYAYEWRWFPFPSGPWSAVVSTSNTCNLAMTAPMALEVKIWGADPTPAVGYVEVYPPGCIDMIPPNPVTTLGPDLVSQTSMYLTWTAPVDTVCTFPEPCYAYDMRQSQPLITEGTFGSAAPVLPSNPEPTLEGGQEYHQVEGLTACTWYYFALKSRDATPNWSFISNVPHIKTLCSGGGGPGYAPDPLVSSRSSQGSTEPEEESATVIAAGRLYLLLHRTGDGPPGLTIGRSATLRTDEDLVDHNLVLAQSPDSAGRWRTTGTFRLPPNDSFVGLVQLRDNTRYVFGDGFDLSRISSATSADSLIAATSTRLGDVKGAINSSEEIELFSDETITLSYVERQPSADPVSGSPWYALFEHRDGSGAARQQDLSGRDDLPASFALYQNQPNPFSQTTYLRFDLPRPTTVKLTIYDVTGRKVRTLSDEDWPAGRHSLTWDHHTDAGVRLGAGAYVYRLQAGEFRAERKMVLLPR